MQLFFYLNKNVIYFIHLYREIIFKNIYIFIETV